MRIATPRLSRVSRVCAIGLLAVSSPGCKRRAPLPTPGAVPSLGASVAPAEEPTLCRRRVDFGLMPTPNPQRQSGCGDYEEDARCCRLWRHWRRRILAVRLRSRGSRSGQSFWRCGRAASRRFDLGELHVEP